jgi:hypothetical protein
MQKATMLEVLTWVYRDELPKQAVQGFGESWARVERAGESGGYDCQAAPRAPVALGAPHPDAEWLAEMVYALPVVDMMGADAAGVQEGLAAAQVLLGPMAGFLTAGDMAKLVKHRISLPAAIQSLALGVLKPPVREVWCCEAVRDIKGHVVQADVRYHKQSVRLSGKTVRVNMMISGYCPVLWSPDVLSVFEERMRWCVLVNALEGLVRAVQAVDRLDLWVLQGIGVAVEPWRGDVHRRFKGQLLQDLTRVEPVVAHDKPVIAMPAVNKGGRPRKVELSGGYARLGLFRKKI